MADQKQPPPDYGAGQPGYPPPGQPGYPPPGQPGYPPPGQPGYPPPGQPGYPPPGQPGYPPPGQPGAPPGGVQAPPGVPGQQQATQWMARPETIPGCPPGLEYLTQIDQLLVHQQIELLEVVTDWETPNKYAIKNTMGQQVYFAAEESGECMRQCCSSDRGFVMHITDNLGQEVIRVNREFKCCAGCNWCAGSDCCAMVVTIEAPPGNHIGTVKQAASFLAPKYQIMDASDNVIFCVEGPVCMCQGPCCTQDMDFNVTSPDGQHQVGKISKQWSGMVREYFTAADNFGITFPMDLDVKMKACMVGALFLIDFMYFENKNNDNNN